jgi:hypothetical protein
MAVSLRENNWFFITDQTARPVLSFIIEKFLKTFAQFYFLKRQNYFLRGEATLHCLPTVPTYWHSCNPRLVNSIRLVNWISGWTLEPIPTTWIYNAGAVIIYTAVSSLVRFKNRNIFFYFKKHSTLLQRWRCSCKFRRRRIGSWLSCVQAGWPDWANFCLWDNCLPWVVFFEITEIFGPLSTVHMCIQGVY